MIRTTMMAKRNTTKNIRGGLGQWPGKGNWEHKNITTTMTKKRQPRTQEKDHDHGNGQKERNQEQKKMTMITVMARRSATKNRRK
jgi:hypothetical protein